MQTIKEVEINLLRGVDPTNHQIARYMPYTYLVSLDLDKWTQAHDGGRHYGAMTTKIFECFNRVLKGARGLPIAAMVEFIWCKFVHISTIDINKLLLISLEVMCGVIMQWSDYTWINI